MKFGGLSEREIQKISEILSVEGISFEITSDKDIQGFNEASMRNNLRHYNPPVISTHVLAIELSDDDFARISAPAKKKLQELGITDEVPSVEDFIPHTGETIQKELLKGQNRVVAYNLKHQIIVVLVIFFVVWLVKKMI